MRDLTVLQKFCKERDVMCKILSQSDAAKASTCKQMCDSFLQLVHQNTCDGECLAKKAQLAEKVWGIMQASKGAPRSQKHKLLGAILGIVMAASSLGSLVRPSSSHAQPFVPHQVFSTLPPPSTRDVLPKQSDLYKAHVANATAARIVQDRRYEWTLKHPEQFKAMLKREGYQPEATKAMLERRRPLDFPTQAEYDEFRDDVDDARRTIMNRYKLDSLRFVHQGSSVAGYSSNPKKGGLRLPDGSFDPNIPNYLYNKALGSDTDLRVASDDALGLLRVAEARLREGQDVNFKTGGGRETLVEPDDATKFFPELKPLIDKWAPRLGKLQVTIDTKPADANFEPNPWDMEIKERSPGRVQATDRESPGSA